MPHAHTDTDADEDPTADDTGNSPLTNSRLLDDGLQQVHRDITAQLATVEREGEQIKQVVGYAIVGSHADSATTQDLQQQLVTLLSELHNSHDGVTIDDIALALWAELTRVSEMALLDDEDTEDDDQITSDPDNETDPDASKEAEDRTDDEGLGELFGSDDTEDTTQDNAPDRAFQ